MFWKEFRHKTPRFERYICLLTSIWKTFLLFAALCSFAPLIATQPYPPLEVAMPIIWGIAGVGFVIILALRIIQGFLNRKVAELDKDI